MKFWLKPVLASLLAASLILSSAPASTPKAAGAQNDAGRGETGTCRRGPTAVVLPAEPQETRQPQNATPAPAAAPPPELSAPPSPMPRTPPPATSSADDESIVVTGSRAPPRSEHSPSAVAVTRSDAGLSSTISTVDDVNAESGRMTTVLALGELINGGRPGQYGVGQGASSVTLPQ